MKKHVRPEDLPDRQAGSVSEGKEEKKSTEGIHKAILSEPAKTKQPGPAPAVAAEKPSNPLDRLCQLIEKTDKRLIRKLEPELTSLEKLMKEREDYLQLLQRVQADFDNYQKRIKREKEEWEKYQHEDMVKEFLPALDNLDRSTKLKCESDDAKSLLEGVELTRREILRVLEKNGVTIIKLQNKKFDPAFHEAVGTMVSNDKPPGTILEEVKPGFMLHDRVLRPSHVIVTVAPQKTESNTDK